MEYKEALAYLDSFVNYERQTYYPYKQSLKLKRIINFLKTIDNPHKSLKVIHVAGTKGKGSTSSFIAHILKEAGYKVGLYTSPHLTDFRERIRILDRKNSLFDEFEGMISQSEVVKLVEQLKPKIDSFNKKFEEDALSFFEIFTSLAFVYFKQKKVDFAVLETGLGGRLDATNVVKPLVCAITPISLEHTQYLGTKLSEIAEEKAGIIKNNSIVISAPQAKSAEKVLRDKVRRSAAKIYFLGKGIKISHEISKLEEQKFDVKSLFKTYKDLRITLKGHFQITNAALAVAVADALKFRKIEISEDAIRSGLFSCRWPARFEMVNNSPAIIIDGAQNVHSAGVLMDAVKKLFKGKKIILVLGVSGDKDIKGIGEIFRDAVDTVILTRANNPRGAAPARIQEEGGFKDPKITKSVDEAVLLAKSLAEEDDLILIAGSLFVAGEARELLLKKDKFHVAIEQF